jgi:hypothetical protein
MLLIMPFLWNVLSVSLVLVFLAPWVMWLFFGDLAYAILGVCSLGVVLSTKVMKVWLGGGGGAFGRPAGACTCDIMCTGGNVAGQAGFPSGHMAVTAFVIGALAMRFQGLSRAVAAVYIGSMGLARWSKRCHSWLQIVAGTLYGLSLAYVFHHAVELYKER